MFTPKERRAAYNRHRAAKAFRALLPWIGVAYAISALLWSGTSDFQTGIR